jgi:uncharacterized membrane protein
MVIFGLVELLLSHLYKKKLNRVSWLSVTATIMSLIYSEIGLGLGIAKVAGTTHKKEAQQELALTQSLTLRKKWKRLQALGAIAFAYSFSIILIEIQVCIFLLHYSFLHKCKLLHRIMNDCYVA